MMNLEKDNPVIVPTFADGKRHEVVVHTGDEERIRKTILGDVNVLPVTPIMKFKGLYDKDGDTVIWLTNDECRIPVRINSKILIGLLALIGFNVQTFYGLVTGNIIFIDYLFTSKWLLFIINFAIAGAIYGILFSIGLLISKHKEFSKEFKQIMKTKEIKKIRRFMFNFTLAIIIIFIINYLMRIFTEDVFVLLIGFFPIVMFYIWVSAKAIDNGCMNKKIYANKITIGDWVIKNVYVKRRTKDLLKEAYREFYIKDDKKLSLHAFTQNIALKYRKHKQDFFSMLFLRWNKKELAKEVHIVKTIMQSSSVSLAMKKAKTLKIDKKDIGEFIGFLESIHIYFDKFLVCGFQNTGLTENQVKIVNQLYKQKKIRMIKIKNGLPFIPSFLLGFLIFYFLGFWWKFLL
jgi:prepilin signal peptidase PulO-like enzyme (type II secretory pathway)